jgi:hypothetical protein
MNFIKRMLRLARESDVGSRDQYFYESAALGTVKGMVSIWADDYHRGEKLKGHHLNKWAKDVLKRVQQLDAEFNEDEKIRKEVEK